MESVGTGCGNCFETTVYRLSLVKEWTVEYTTTVYEGDKSRVGRETKPDCWQENRPLRSYAKEVVRVYDGAKIKIKNGVMEVTK